MRETADSERRCEGLGFKVQGLGIGGGLVIGGLVFRFGGYQGLEVETSVFRLW